MRATFTSQARVACAALLGLGGVASAQLSNASTAATGLGAYTAVARGYNAVFWNPANLAMPGNPGFSMTLAAVDGTAGLRPITFSKLADPNITREMRERWLLDVEAQGAQKGDLFGGVTGIGMNFGPIAFTVNAKAVSSMDLSPGGTEALLFGNFGRDSTLRNLELAGSRVRSAAFTTGAVSYAIPFGMIPLPDFSLGFTGKYIAGQGLMIARDAGSIVDSLPDFLFPAVVTDDSTRHDLHGAGSGFGLDLGAAWTVPGFRFGVSIQNVVNTFRWDTTRMEMQEASAALNHFDATGDRVKQPYASAPADLREEVAAMRFKPVIAAGVSFDWLPKITVAADIRQQVGGGIEVGPESMVAAGAEARWIPFLPVRAGVQMMSGGLGVSGGLAIRVIGMEMGVAGFVRNRNGAQESGATLNVISIRP